MKKILIIIIIVFLLSGCKIKYELNIDENYNHFENIAISGDSSELGISNISSLSKLYINENSLYSVKKQSSNVNNYSTLIEGSMGDYEIYKTSEAISHFYNLSVLEKENQMIYTYIPKTEYNQNSTNLNSIDTIEIIVTSANPIKESNASKVVDNKYYWTISDEIKEITFTLDTTNKKEENSTLSQFFKDNNINPNYIEFIILAIIIGIVFAIIIKSKKRNRI